MSYECKKINNHSGMIVVDDCIMQKPYIKQNYMGDGVPFHPSFIPTLGHKHTLPIPLVGNNEFFYKKFKNTFRWMPMLFLPRSIKRPLNGMTNGLVVVDIKGSWMETYVVHSNGFEWNCGNGIRCNLF